MAVQRKEEMRAFRKLSGELVQLDKHTRAVVDKHPHVEVHVGTDSQVIGRYIKYATVVAYRYGTRGVHYVLSTEKIKKVDFYTRLWKEVEDSMKVALWLRERMPSLNIEVDFDLNGDKKHKSNQLVTAAVGWAKGEGFNCNIKPNRQIATKAADCHCR